MNKRTLGKIILFIASFLWGMGFIATDIALSNGWQPFAILSFRGLVSSIVLIPFTLKTKWYKNMPFIKDSIIAGIVLSAAFCLQVIGQQLTTTSNASFLTALYVVFVPFLGFVFQKRKFEKKVYFCAILALIGSAILSVSNDLSINVGDFIVIGSAVLYGAHFLVVERISHYNDPTALTTIQLLVMGVSCLILQIIFKQTYHVAGLMSVLFLALIGSGIAFFMQIFGQQYLDSPTASLILTLEGVWGALGAVLILGEPFTLKLLLGGGLLLISIYLIEYQPSKKRIKKYRNYSKK
ncbi:MAG: DMT family transporter [Erysipelotrichaceae bacterium]